MTIARRLMLLLAVPLVILVALGVLSLVELARIESRSRFVAELQVPSLAALGNITRLHGELRVAVRNYVMSADPEERRTAREAFESGNVDISRRLDEYARSLVSDERDRELMADYRKAMEDWNAAARQIMASAEPGRRDEAAAALLQGPARELGERLGQSSQEWIRHNEELAARAGALLIGGVAAARRDTLLAVAAGLILSGALGYWTFRRIARPIRALQTSVESIAGGDYGREVPFTGAEDETGDLARSVEILKRSAMRTDELLDETRRQKEELEVQQKELEAARRKAEEATELKSLFLANMSHEIRTPMNAIIGLSHLALKTALTPKQKDYIGKVHAAGTSLLGIINDILDFSKIEAGRLDFETTPFSLDEVISTVTTVTGQKAHEKGLEFLADMPSSVPQNLIGDPLRLGQILTNLVNNAVKFTEHGEIRMKVELLEKTGGRVKLRFSVRDTGAGVTPDQAARLFQPFVQADMSTTRKHGGTGLGLTICKRLVELMGGEIWLESQPGAGSTFFFTVWMGLGTEAPRGQYYPEELQHLAMLVVDDNATAREILADALRDISARVDMAASGAEALSAVRRHDRDHPYDVVFMDWRMPDMDGLQATREIRADAALKRTPAIVLVTAFGREEVREEAEKLDVSGFLLKPVTKSMLVDTLVSIFAPAPDEKRRPSTEVVLRRLNGIRILLAEDNPINQQIAVELLESAGAAVEVAENGAEAARKLASAAPPGFDIVLMDLQMPEMDGYQATAKIRSDPRFEKLPIIAMTAHATMEERQRCLEAGMNDHVSKPIVPDILYATVERWAKPAQAATTVAAESKPDAAAPAGIPAIEGIDAADGLARVAGNAPLYRRLLERFAEEEGAAGDAIARALDGGDRNRAERGAHTVKGVAGNLAMGRLRDAAGALERAIRDGSSEASPALAEFHTVLRRQVDAIRTALGGSAPMSPSREAPAAPFDAEAARRAVARLRHLLASSDGEAAEAFAGVSRVLSGAVGQSRLDALARAIDDFDFEGALVKLDAIARDCSIEATA